MSVTSYSESCTLCCIKLQCWNVCNSYLSTCINSLKCEMRKILFLNSYHDFSLHLYCIMLKIMMMTIKQRQQMYALKGSTSRTHICASYFLDTNIYKRRTWTVISKFRVQDVYYYIIIVILIIHVVLIVMNTAIKDENSNLLISTFNKDKSFHEHHRKIPFQKISRVLHVTV